MTTLILKAPPEAPLEAGSVVPDSFAGKSIEDIRGMPVAHGNRAGRLGDFFEVHEDGTGAITLKGDLSRVKNIASGMTYGTVTTSTAAPATGQGRK
jgi:formylmethanofuran dehydrogenase subunit C